MNSFRPRNFPHGWQSRPTDQDQNSSLHPWDGFAIRGHPLSLHPWDGHA